MCLGPIGRPFGLGAENLTRASSRRSSPPTPRSPSAHPNTYKNKLHHDGKASNICGDCVIRLTGYNTKHLYPEELRLVRARDSETGEIIDFITNNFELSAQDVASIYRHRWDIEIFFKWIKQNIVIKTLWGYSENAVKTHLWVAICTYLILARIKKELKSQYSITEIATLVSVSALEKHELRELLMTPQEKLLRSNQNQKVKELQLELFN